MKYLGSSILIYGGGAVALMLSDLIITSAFSPPEIAQWAVFRSLVGLSAVLPLIGLDQVIVRSPSSSTRLLGLLSVQVPILSLCVGLFLVWTGFVREWWIGTGLAAGSAGSLVLFQYFRSHHHRALAQMAQQGWKILVFVLLCWLVWSETEANILLAGVCLLLVVDILGLCILMRLQSFTLYQQAPEPARALYAIGSRFMVTASFLAFSVYAEQLVVNKLGSAKDAALYFTSTTYFLFPMSFLNGYIAFLIGPWIRNNRARYMTALRRFRLHITAGALLYALGLSLAGWLGWQLMFPSVGMVDPRLQAIFAASCFARTLYVLPSGYFGVFGRPRQHDVLIVSQIVTAGIVIGFFVALRAMDVEIIYAVGLASTTNWILRTFTAYFVMVLIDRKRGDA